MDIVLQIISVIADMFVCVFLFVWLVSGFKTLEEIIYKKERAK